MNSLIESLNAWGGRFLDIALPLLWQSVLLIALVFGIDWLLRRKLRPAIRSAFWLVVMIKLVLPPSLALPTGAAWWLRTRKAAPPAPPRQVLLVTYGPSEPALAPVFVNQPPPPCPASAKTFFSSRAYGAVCLRQRFAGRVVNDAVAKNQPMRPTDSGTA